MLRAGLDAARYNCLNTLNDLCHGDRRIDPLIGKGGMASLARDKNLKKIRGTHSAPGCRRKVTNRQIGQLMQGKDGPDAEAIHQAIFDHRQSGAIGFFGWLENQDHRSVKTPVIRQIPRGPEQHCGVAIMAACAHSTICL